ncbi:GDP-L-fucose synthase [Tangfeifania diversioriginum]|uniref:GDP-L-fucose synthase n=1 Tax=Tangfeifania diversioriginum TaxID=1168035 RepID=A0A1M6JAK1_9BACT|nr:GDP-L-fucose synthase [Tangfeifania diversioriginum]SHJ43672.1 GDP-L-fucose synthase [Tangfeifania diversioriginum]
MEHNSKIYIAGHRGLVGSAIWKKLQQKGYTNLVGKTHTELNLLDQHAVEQFFADEKPEHVFLAAAKVGGIMANNTYRADFLYENLVIQNNVIHNAWKYGTKKLLFLGSTCIYPKNAAQPMKEDALLTSPLEYTNEPYAIAKIAGIKLCESYNLQYGTNFLSVMPTNLYGPNDNFDLEKSHVLPALLRKIHLGKCLENSDWKSIGHDLNKRPIEGIDGEASNNKIVDVLSKYGIVIPNEKRNLLQPGSKQPGPDPAQRHGMTAPVSVEIWGTGTPLREFLWSEEMADACIYLMQNINFTNVALSSAQLEKGGTGGLTSETRNTHINIGTGREISIKALAELIAKTVGFKGDLLFNSSKPDGTPRKLTDVSKLHALGWHHDIEIEEGIKKLYHWFTTD